MPPPPRPRILVLTDRAPGSQSGHAIRVANTITALASIADLCVVLVDVSEEPDDVAKLHPSISAVVPARRLSRLGRLLRFPRLLPTDVHYRARRRLRREIADAAGDGPWDLVWCVRARLDVLTDGLVPGPRVVDLDDLDDQLLRRKIRDRRSVHGALRTLPQNVWDWVDALRWKRLHRLIAARVARVVVCSDDDLTELGAANGALVPNGYPEPTAPQPAPVGRAGEDAPGPTMLFVGALTYEPNRLAVEWFAADVLPAIRRRVPEARLVVAGDVQTAPHLGPAADAVELAGRVPDVAPYYRSARVAVCPLHSGGGTRLKVLEALARRVPLATTSFGCAGFGLRPGVDALIADAPAALASACVDLLGDAELRRRVTSAGRQRYEREFDARACEAAIRALAQTTWRPPSAPLAAPGEAAAAAATAEAAAGRVDTASGAARGAGVRE